MRRLALALVLVVVVAGCEWPQFLYNPEHTGSSPDTSISEDAVRTGTVALQWSGALGGSPLTPTVVAGGTAYIGGQINSDPNLAALYAFDAAGNSNCSDAARTCQPLWTTTPISTASVLPPSIAGSVALVVPDGLPLRAYDAAGVANCGGAPKRCDPLWAANGDFPSSTAAVGENGFAYQGFYSTDTLVGAGIAAYDLAGATNCSGTPKTCGPVWTGRIPRVTQLLVPAVANGVVYVTSDTTLFAFDAAGNTNCAGSPKTCTPLWQADIPNGTQVGTAPVVAGGFVFQASGGGELYAFDATGNTNCTGSPQVCTPLWFANASGIPSVGKGVLYALAPQGRLGAFDAAGARRCSGSPRQCHLLWSYKLPHISCNPPGPCGTRSPVAIVNGVLYLSSTLTSGSPAVVTAFDASGQTNCSGTPPVCTELAHWNGVGFAPSVADGFLYAASPPPGQPRLDAFGPP